MVKPVPSRNLPLVALTAFGIIYKSRKLEWGGPAFSFNRDITTRSNAMKWKLSRASWNFPSLITSLEYPEVSTTQPSNPIEPSEIQSSSPTEVSAAHWECMYCTYFNNLELQPSFHFFYLRSRKWARKPKTTGQYETGQIEAFTVMKNWTLLISIDNAWINGIYCKNNTKSYWSDQKVGVHVGIVDFKNTLN